MEGFIQNRVGKLTGPEKPGFREGDDQTRVLVYVVRLVLVQKCFC